MEFLSKPITFALCKGREDTRSSDAQGKEDPMKLDRPSATPPLPTPHQDSCFASGWGGGVLITLLGPPPLPRACNSIYVHLTQM